MVLGSGYKGRRKEKKPASESEEKSVEPEKEREKMTEYCPHCEITKLKADIEVKEAKAEADRIKAERDAFKAEIQAAKTTPLSELSEDDACKKFGLCKKADLDATKKELDDLLNSHSQLTEEFLTKQETCPTCAPKLKAYVEKKIKEQGLVKPEPKVEPAKAPEDVPSWRR